ncbi:iron-sulfur cluster binding protein [Actinoplanes sp. SE50]|uniref:lactate utilization protein B n=1 Tax=unclassified Actinoplanes TaxID=2626549 RepID=UPI00023EBBB5|nr:MULTISPECIES: lactate utilization protein B [unclassified Actinoplanes]AEV85058.1 iron-sulfur cluster binding protein [Actinoplanes sp. SE50/110]ATO83449.1 iron-sulfur cluster binding protein [Actinoplanes sp. SE50]SLM00856.1 iron-sulfur cluster-binding protein [Actinoplanes sp. SE50/110]
MSGLGIPGTARGVPFPTAAARALADEQLRANLRRATSTIRRRRDEAVGEIAGWEQLRDAAAAIKAETMARLPELLERFEAAATAAGAQVHWARDAVEAGAIVARLVAAAGASEVVKVKSMATQEIALNHTLARSGVDVVETDLAELIVQLADDVPSHILVPAIHYNRKQIRDLFRDRMPDAPADLSDDPHALAAAARAHLRARFLSAQVAVSGANFAIAESGTLVVVESEGNGRMCLTLPRTLISVVGIEKIIPRFTDLSIFLRLLPRSSTGERMNPYTSTWTGVTPDDGPQQLHIVLLDNGRSATLADPVGRQALHCIRCSACLNVCPVYERTGGHAYGSVYPGPIGAVLTPQLTGVAANPSLPFASTLCGACYDVCPVKIDIPRVLVHLRQQAVLASPAAPEGAVMRALTWTMSDRRRYERALRAARAGAAPLVRILGRRTVRRLPAPLSPWTRYRDAPLPAAESFRDWWRRNDPRT